MRDADPRDVALDLDAVRARRAAERVGQVLAGDLDDAAVGVFAKAGAAHDVAVLEPHHAARLVADRRDSRKKPFCGVSWKSSRSIHSSRVNGKLPLAARPAACGCTGAVQTSLRSAGIVRDDEADRIEDRERARRLRIEVVAQRLLEFGVVGPAVRLRHAAAVAQQADAGRRVAAPPQARPASACAGRPSRRRGRRRPAASASACW